MKKLSLCFALVVASCQPAMAVSTEQCLELKSAFLLANLDRNADYNTAVNIVNKFNSISIYGALEINNQVSHYFSWVNGSDVGPLSDERFDQCLQNDPKFNTKYFKGEK